MVYHESMLRHLSPAAFGMLGAMDMAYVRPVKENGIVRYRIFAANGQFLGEERDAAVALVVARQNGYEAHLVN